jgi:hypothetical protein
MAPHLMTPPPDLTRISQRRAGRFDHAEVAAFIDGSQRVSGHGSNEMPVWESFDDGTGEGVTRLDSRAVALIVEYLDSIQVPRDR